MSLDKMQQVIGSLAKKINDNHKIATPVLAKKIARCLDAYPHDQTLGAMSLVIEKMASNNNLFITRGALKSLYHDLYYNNTKFAELFGEELGSVAIKEFSPTNRDDSSKEIDPYEFGDQALANALGSVFDKGAPLKMYSQKLADKAVYSVATTLDSWGLKPTSLYVSDGSDKFLVLKADYETPKGVTSLYVPVEVVDNKLCEASVFMGNSGPVDLNNTNIKNYVTSNAGNKSKVSGTQILDVLTKAASEQREISDAEMALLKVNSSRKSDGEFYQNQIVGQKLVSEAKADIELPKLGDFDSFEEQFNSSVGTAAFHFGADKVNIARDNIIRDLVSMGHRNPQVALTNHNENTVFYSVSLDSGKVAFKVPVNIVAGVVNKPTVFICNGSISSFDKVGINDLYLNEQTDLKAAAAASQFGLMKSSELVEAVRVSLAEGNQEKAEEALNVLASLGDEKAYAMGFQAYLNGLGQKKAEASCECECTMQIKNGTSKYPICGHTGLPINKVYQDSEGNCRPLYRKGMDESYDGASFMNAKIFG